MLTVNGISFVRVLTRGRLHSFVTMRRPFICVGASHPLFYEFCAMWRDAE